MSEKRLYPSKWIITGGAFIVGLFGVWYGLPETPVQGAVCRQIPTSWQVPGTVCADRYREVSEVEAADVIDTYLGRASGARPQRALSLFSAGVEANPAGFIKTWSAILYADRQGDVRRSERGRNWFTFTYVTYGGGGDDIAPKAGNVNAYTVDIQLTKTADGIEISRLEPPDRIAGSRVRYQRRQPSRVIQTYDQPSRENVAAPSVRPEQWLSLLCQVDFGERGWWSRTGWGWVAHADLRSGDTEVADVPSCDAHHLYARQ